MVAFSAIGRKIFLSRDIKLKKKGTV